MGKRGLCSKDLGSRRKAYNNNRRTKHKKEKRDVLLINSVFSTKGIFFRENVKNVHLLDNDIILSAEQLLILSFGPNFIPSIDNDPIDHISCVKKTVLLSIEKIIRSVIIKKHRFLNTDPSYTPATNTNNSLIIPNPSYYPPHNSHEYIALHCYTDEIHSKLEDDIQLFK